MLFALVQLFLSTCVFAAPVTFNDYDDFMAALPGSASVLDFDSQHWLQRINPGDTIEGITFDYPGPETLMVNFFPIGSTSAFLNLGTTNTSNDNWISSMLPLSFEAQNAIGMYFLMPDQFMSDSVSINVNGQTLFRDSINNGQQLLDGEWAFFFGLIDEENSFTEALVGSQYNYGIDDIVTAKNDLPQIPEPSTILLLGIGLLGFAGVSRRRNY